LSFGEVEDGNLVGAEVRAAAIIPSELQVQGQLQRQGVRFHKDDNAFLSVSDPQALQTAADSLSAEIIRKRLDYWTLVLGPKLSKKDRAAVRLRRDYSLNQVEYCRNFIFRRNFPIHKIFER
jgi:hypothetical protein